MSKVSLVWRLDLGEGLLPRKTPAKYSKTFVSISHPGGSIQVEILDRQAHRQMTHVTWDLNVVFLTNLIHLRHRWS